MDIKYNDTILYNNLHLVASYVDSRGESVGGIYDKV